MKISLNFNAGCVNIQQVRIAGLIYPVLGWLKDR